MRLVSKTAGRAGACLSSHQPCVVKITSSVVNSQMQSVVFDHVRRCTQFDKLSSAVCCSHVPHQAPPPPPTTSSPPPSSGPTLRSTARRWLTAAPLLLLLLLAQARCLKTWWPVVGEWVHVNICARPAILPGLLSSAMRLKERAVA